MTHRANWENDAIARVSTAGDINNPFRVRDLIYFLVVLACFNALELLFDGGEAVADVLILVAYLHGKFRCCQPAKALVRIQHVYISAQMRRCAI